MMAPRNRVKEAVQRRLGKIPDERAEIQRDYDEASRKLIILQTRVDELQAALDEIDAELGDLDTFVGAP